MQVGFFRCNPGTGGYLRIFAVDISGAGGEERSAAESPAVESGESSSEVLVLMGSDGPVET